MKKIRLESIDIARSICIVLVVIGHYIPENSPQWYMTLHGIIYSFHMPLFLFVSGYVYWMTRKPISYKEFIKKKFRRLMIPYLAVSVIIIFIKMITEKSITVENPVTWKAFAEMFYLPSAGFFLWFVYALFLMFLIIPFFQSIKKLNILFVISLILLLLPVSFTNFFCLEQWKNHFFYFVLGCVTCREEGVRHFIGKYNSLLTTVLCTGIYAIIFSFFTQSVNLLNASLSLLLALLGILFVVSVSRFIKGKSTFVKRFFLWLSVYSYTIYLFHTTFEGFAKALLLKMTIPANNDVYFSLTTGVVVLVGLFGPVVLSFLFDKISNLLKNRFGKQEI